MEVHGMAQSIREVMTPNPAMCPATSTVADAARFMRDSDVGDVLVERDGTVCGIVTDRDIVVRAIADGQDPAKTKVGDICSRTLVSLSPVDSVEDAVRLMREKALRRLPILEDDRVVGIVSIGDLAVERDPDSALADISAAPPNT
jgi:CBS domain-containing protein